VCLDSKKIWPKMSHQIFGHMHIALNVDEKKSIVQFACKLRDESFEPNCAVI
jgi:transcriptional regulator of NAD metabolism